ncbi:NifU N-terminal domain-containing protein [Staphylococcus gallinarum]|uniref:NifU N-terminal domain-containing protein n=1 Tax=Staphylococcus gallinarum TaxID=1293 RepID=UPI001E43E5C9|nr:NifU N-terminal domain-containing protein [Staphylococcus gallinarum]MCD8828214.1 NifU N-terminal domain-containing protein [Staphylococcus gallinarum]MDN6412688.1 NifU N-terminal domain-containing protein [Staphylococcus gallinarum]MEB6055002.1 NifU N-terminal domain-containing protein [Staphylococcus gallinarum]
MDIKGIEQTPSPNTIKVVLNEAREGNQSNTYNAVKDDQPAFINALLAIEEVTSIFYVMDFLAINKSDESDWDTIIPKITETLEEA